MAFVIPVIEHWLDQEIAQCVHHEGSIWQPITPTVDALSQSYILLPASYSVFQVNCLLLFNAYTIM